MITVLSSRVGSIVSENSFKIRLFVDDVNACNATWAVHVIKLRVTDWLFLDPTGISDTRSNLKIT